MTLGAYIRDCLWFMVKMTAVVSIAGFLYIATFLQWGDRSWAVLVYVFAGLMCTPEAADWGGREEVEE